MREIITALSQSDTATLFHTRTVKNAIFASCAAPDLSVARMRAEGERQKA